MNVLLSCIGLRGYIADFFREALPEGSNIIGTSNTPYTPGFFHCDKNFILPSIHEKEAYLSNLIDLCERENVNLLLSFLDADIDLISCNTDKFKHLKICLMVAPKPMNLIAWDKWETYQFLKKQNFHCPYTSIDLKRTITDIEERAVNFPLYIKPRNGFASINNFKATNIDELKVFFNYQENMLIQEFIAGKEFSFDMLFDMECSLVSLIVKEKILMRAGETQQGRTIRNQNLEEFGKSLASRLEHRGPLDIDFLVKDEIPYVIDLNPRFGGGYPLSHLAGADFPKKIIRIASGEKLFYSSNYSEVTMMKDIKLLSGLPKIEKN